MLASADPAPAVSPDRASPGGAAPTTFREVERKVRVPATFSLPALAGAVVGVAAVRPGDPVTMVAAYHDTPDVRLIRWGATLRRREGGGDEGWHLKLPVEGAGPGVRDELGLPLAAGAVGSVPAEISDIVRSLVREAPLVHVSTVRTTRAPYALLDDAGRQVAELVDDQVEVVEGGRVVRVFHEIEVEARVADDGAGLAVLDAVVEALVAAGGVPGTEGKAAAALGARATGVPDVVVPPWPGPGGPAGDAVRCVLALTARKFLLQDVRVRRNLPDSVHQMRVAARTLRSALRTFAPLVDREWADGLREELRWAADALGVARDTEVLLARLDSHADALAPDDAARALPVIDTWLRGRLEDARRAALTELRTDRHLRLLGDLVDAAREPRLTRRADRPSAEALPPLVEKAWRRLVRAVEDLELDGPAEEWHRARILGKRARYAAEAVAPVLGEPAKRRGGALERVTDLLGDHHDAFVARQMLRELAGHPGVDGRTGYALGLLDAVEAGRERSDRVRFQAVWPDVHRVHREWPLGAPPPR